MADLSLEQQLALTKQQLTQAQRLAALGELVSTTTHEFNNVLMTIINYAQMGIRHKDQATRDKAFEKILAAGQRAAKITNSVLGVARNRSSSFEPTNLVKLVTESLVLLEREMSKYRIHVETQFADVPNFMAIGNQIQQVLLNLLIKVDHDAQAQTVDLTIRDSGCGIPAEKLPRIFEPFYSTKTGPDESGRGGTGLGLSACRNIIEAHQGRMRVESTPGKGTQFIIKFPIQRVTAPATTSLPPLPVVGGASTETIGPIPIRGSGH
ncbi:MAG: hypothetical protein RIS70_896 [Planctomycetota bacterium]